MNEKLERLAEGLLMEMISSAEGVDASDIDAVVVQVVKEMDMIVITRPKDWTNGYGDKPKVAAVRALNRLLRRGRLEMRCDRPFVYLAVQPEVLRLVGSSERPR